MISVFFWGGGESIVQPISLFSPSRDPRAPFTLRGSGVGARRLNLLPALALGLHPERRCRYLSQANVASDGQRERQCNVLNVLSHCDVLESRERGSSNPQAATTAAAAKEDSLLQLSRC